MPTRTISDQFQLTIDPDILRRAGFQPGDTVRIDDSGESVVIRRSDGRADSKTTGARIEEIVNYVRELRGHDEFD
jgi:bifunctional DNA-binding transcriptional regulator/antitoxin component of YhaV-PrlF toxin-antitoxin module